VREFEFRAWCVEYKEMIHNKRLTLCMEDGLVLMTTKKWMEYRSFVKGDAVLMQYTGFKDKNGKKKIFEDDIVKQKMPSGDIYFGKVIFSQGAFRIEEPYKIYCKELIGGLAEVLGNIYINPKMLEDK